MAYIVKNTTGLINTRVTDVGRQKMSQGNFVIKYFQVGDSEVCYNCTSGYTITNNNILEPCFNSQNASIYPAVNKQNVKYPYYVDVISGGTYGIPFDDSRFDSVYNAAAQRGFFSGTTGSLTRQNATGYTINSELMTDISLFSYSDTISLVANPCIGSFVNTAQVEDFIMLYCDGAASCFNVDCNYPTLFYRMIGGSSGSPQLDRNTPGPIGSGFALANVLPSGMTVIYDTYTPSGHWYTDVINFESVCGIDAFDVKIWNMNIPWTETPAGINNAIYNDYNFFGSVSYIGTKEYLGYNSTLGHYCVDSVGNTIPNSYYYDSFDDIVEMTPEEQKSIAIVHYTNNTIDLFYGEKFAFEPFNPANPTNTTGQAVNFKVSLPWLAWHKAPTNVTSGQTFYVDPPGFSSLNLCQPKYILSKINDDMNFPGIRYYDLWDTNANIDGFPNRVGKVFPDQKIIVFDDDEVIAAMSYKSNRSWTLPAPKLSLVTPNLCAGSTSAATGIMSSDTEYMYVTYRLDNSLVDFYSLHCNYYRRIAGPASGCSITPQDVAVRFGDEFPYMNTSTSLQGFKADQFKILCQKVTGDTRPIPTEWREIDFTSGLPVAGTGYLTPAGLISNTFVITEALYNAATLYDLSTYMTLTLSGFTGSSLDFGDEYYFYGTIDTDIQATIYEMRFLCNLNSSEFQFSSNPTWTTGSTSYVTEVGLFNEDKDLLVVSKLQSPVQRLGVQQFLVKFDF